MLSEPLSPSLNAPAGPAPAEAPPVAHEGLRILLDEHAALASMLRSILLMIDRGPGDEPERFFDVLRAMLFYIDEFPERLHHAKESDYLFPRLARRAPELLPVIERLERDHMQGEGRVRALQHALLAWEMLGESRRAEFVEAAREYVGFYFEHMRLEEAEILPAAARLLSAEDWQQITAVLASHRDPFARGGPADAIYDRLFTRIVTAAPAPIGVGRA